MTFAYLCARCARATSPQFPVYENGRCVGLLTTNTIARWVAADLGDDSKLDASTVRETLKYAEPRDEAVFLPRTISAAAAVLAASDIPTLLADP